MYWITQHIFSWITSGTAAALLHSYFLSFANALPDPKKNATYRQRTLFNFIQGLAGNECELTST